MKVSRFHIHTDVQAADHPLLVAHRTLQIAGVEQCRPFCGKQFLLRIPKHAAKRGVHLDESSVQFAHANTALCVLKHLAEQFFAFAELPFGADALADIAVDGGNGDDLPMGVSDWRECGSNMDPLAVLSQPDAFLMDDGALS